MIDDGPSASAGGPYYALMMPHDAQMTLTVIAAGLIAALGIAAILSGRRGAGGRRIVLPAVGPVSTVTFIVTGLALLAVAYHLVVHALDIRGFRAPMGVAAGAALVAVLASLAADALDHRRG